MPLHYVYELWIRQMYDKYEYGDPKVVLSVDRLWDFIYAWNKCNQGLLMWIIL